VINPDNGETVQVFAERAREAEQMFPTLPLLYARPFDARCSLCDGGLHFEDTAYRNCHRGEKPVMGNFRADPNCPLHAPDWASISPKPAGSPPSPVRIDEVLAKVDTHFTV